MKIGILTFDTYDSIRSRRLYPAARFLKEAAEKRGHVCKVLRVEKSQLYFAKDKRPRVLYHYKRLSGYDVIITRPSISHDVALETAIVKQFELMGLPVINEYSPINLAKNKLRTLQILTHYNIPVPKTIVVRRFEYLDKAIKKLGDFPIILKTPYGSFGRGVAIVESKRALISALDILWRDPKHNVLLIQEYVSEAEGKDIRVFIVGGKVVASMERTAAIGDFRSNLHRGGNGREIKLTLKEKKMALEATKVLKLHISGVDILRSKRGPMIMEVNCNPGLEGITEVTGVDVAGAIIKYAVNFAKGRKAASRYRKRKRTNPKA